jgi:hypothetical protein
MRNHSPLVTHPPTQWIRSCQVDTLPSSEYNLGTIGIRYARDDFHTGYLAEVFVHCQMIRRQRGQTWTAYVTCTRVQN